MKRTLIALAAGALLLTGCSTEQEPETFEAHILYAGQSNRNYTDSCAFEEGTIGAGDSVIVRSSDDRILGKSDLTVRSINPAFNGANKGVCTFETRLDVAAGDTAYRVVLDGFDTVDPKIFDEQEMREGAVVGLQDTLGAGLSDIAGR